MIQIQPNYMAIVGTGRFAVGPEHYIEPNSSLRIVKFRKSGEEYLVFSISDEAGCFVDYGSFPYLSSGEAAVMMRFSKDLPCGMDGERSGSEMTARIEEVGAQVLESILNKMFEIRDRKRRQPLLRRLAAWL